MTCLSDLGAALGDGPLTAAGIATHVRPLFSRILARNSREIYLANHSLGRPLDQTAQDLAEGLSLWYDELDEAWGPWWMEMQSFRAATAALAGAPRVDCIVPKASAGQGLRAVLNSLPGVPRVLASRAEFDSLDSILKQYEALGRAELHWVDARPDGFLHVEDLIPVLCEVDLVVISQVFFANGHVLADLPELVAAAHATGARILLDVYHGYGILPLDLAALDVDYAVAGSYKYLRGGPGSCWLYVSPQALRSGAGTLDTGWFARRDPFAFTRGDKLVLAENGDGWLESTFPPLVFHQSRAGLAFTAAVGVERLRAWNLRQKALLSDLLAARDIPHLGRGPEFGAFLTLPCPDPQELVGRLKRAGVNTDARSAGVRFCPDLLTTDEELEQAVELLAACR
ncbi:MAG: aminotransferase class V-fold PLP-dependent enzyme [Candidatus Delongbacteria bacterium]